MKNCRREKVKEPKESKIITRNKRTTCLTIGQIEERTDYPFGFGEDNKKQQAKTH